MKKINGNEAAPAAEPASAQPDNDSGGNRFYREPTQEPAAPAEVNNELVVQLERMVIDAKAGTLKAVAAGCLVAPGQFYIRVMGKPQHFSDLHSATALLSFRILQSWAHAIDTQVQQAVDRSAQHRRGLVAAAQVPDLPPDLQKLFRK